MGLKDTRLGAGLRAGGSELADSASRSMGQARSEAESRIHDVSFKRGGKVRRTGKANLHKGERVIPRSKVKRVEKMMKRKKMRMTSRRG